MAEDVQGTHEPRFEELREVFAERLAADELGAAIAVDVDGRTVVDLWGGYADAARTRPWREDTIVNVWSSTKTVTALAALVLVERGLLDVFAPVADYWPEFAAAGKGAVEVRHLLAHTSGVSGWDQPFALEDMFDTEAAAARLAAQAPWWEPGTASGYHAAAQGHLIGELVRRITGRTLKDFVREEIAGPLGADFQIGALPGDAARVAEILPPPPLELDLGALDPALPVIRTFTGPVLDAARANDAAWRAAELGALNGHATARGLARMLSPVTLGGTAGGVTLLSPSTIDLIFQEQARGADLVLGVPLRWGIGFGLPEPATLPYLPEGRIAFWGGWGGSMIICDLERRLTVAYVMNRMAPGIIGSDRSAAYLTAVYKALT
ncbi:serine hydrolase domain-containing protein [Actinocorallia longicatena]|uniref:EstA family serine hydrolase n=1 Tax=Actinocorallia longicatena TaxID=111803 RepID=A0ABP6QDI8_9ACTN